MCRGTQLGPRFLQAAKYGGCAIPVKAELRVKCIRVAFWGVCRHFPCPKCGARVSSVAWLLNDLFSSGDEMFLQFSSSWQADFTWKTPCLSDDCSTLVLMIFFPPLLNRDA